MKKSFFAANAMVILSERLCDEMLAWRDASVTRNA